MLAIKAAADLRNSVRETQLAAAFIDGSRGTPGKIVIS